MNRCAVAGQLTARGLRIRPAHSSSRSGARASHRGLPQIAAPSRSAANSRVLEIAACTSMAASGATIMARIEPAVPSGLFRLPPKKQAEIGQHRDRPGDGCRNRHHEGVAILDMGEFMRHHARQLLHREKAEQPCRRRYGSVCRIPSSGKGVGLVLLDNVDPGHRQACAGRKRLYGPVIRRASGHC